MRLDDIQPSHHWFRRIIHVSGACTLVYYLYPDDILWIYILKIAIILTILISAIIVEGLRLRNRLDERFLFPFRPYETKKAGAYIWFCISISVLLLLFPQQIAGPCILISCFGDSLMGELRKKNHVLSMIAGVSACCCIFLIFNYHVHVALFAALTGVGAEGIKSKKIDDDFLMPMTPAIVIYVLTLLGIIPLPEILITPFPV
ncbi:MAG: hypothetical protein QMC80_04435 [Thermoplasmatales archaeon]|nr:hypothetical protein [Thermoplasmatales archaeon]